ncbi:MAG: hypothetical protein Q8N14_05990 [Candidatus Omnitrophota bacterium]|nr:hypothetical protein [Candidatus Omnitrophota bacterium]
MNDSTTKLLTLIAALGLGIFLGKIFFGRKESEQPEIIPTKQQFRNPPIKPVAPIEIKPQPTPEEVKPISSAILEDKILY